MWVTVAALFGSAPVWANNDGKKGHHSSLKLEDTPAAVQQTFRQEAGGGQVEEVRKVDKDGQTFYKAEVVKDGKGTEVKVDATGKVIDRGATHDEAGEKNEHHRDKKEHHDH
jgi:hypothetical protein